MIRAGLAGTALLALAACQTVNKPAMGTHDPRFLNYEERHALSLQQQEHTLPLLVGAHAHGLTSGDVTALEGFLQTYQFRGESSLRVRVPSGSANAHAARRALGDVHDVVARSGGNPGRVRVEHYEVGDPNAHAPIVMVYDRLEAVTNQCGDWRDPMNPALEQSDYFNFGCATQANFAAMLEDPRDLVRPRGLGYPDAGRRAEVLSTYRTGQPTATQTSSEQEAGISEVGN
ncbi:MAG: CpaD family pilus assembly protein [Devosiaceae bacterium]|nr:CpaD family pilus assembly protein [Devosiaceae bacterium MH13]